jgi:hypothetical protein
MSPLLSAASSALVATLILVGATACSVDPQAQEARRVADTLGLAVAYPAQDSAAGFASAIQSTTAGQTGSVEVLDAVDLTADTPQDPLARITILVHVAESEGFTTTPAADFCFNLVFNQFEVLERNQVDCPDHPEPLPPIQQPPHDVVPIGSDKAVRRVLRGLPSSPLIEQVTAEVAQALPAPGADPHSGLANKPPTVLAAVEGSDVGVAVWALDSRTCLIGTRIGGLIEIGFLSHDFVAPGESTCDGATALSIVRQRSTQ